MYQPLGLLAAVARRTACWNRQPTCMQASDTQMCCFWNAYNAEVKCICGAIYWRGARYVGGWVWLFGS